MTAPPAIRRIGLQSDDQTCGPESLPGPRLALLRIQCTPNCNGHRKLCAKFAVSLRTRCYARSNGWLSCRCVSSLSRRVSLLNKPLFFIQLVPMLDYELSWFRPSESGGKRNFVVHSLRDWINWDMDRAYLSSQQEVDEIGAFLQSKAWSFVGNSKARFAGQHMTWVIVLASILYLRALRQREESKMFPPARWALSGNAAWLAQAASYQFPLGMEELRDNLRTMCGYLEELCVSITAPGLPPSLLYLQHHDRMSYLKMLVVEIPPLADLLRLVRKMVSSEAPNRRVAGLMV